MLQGRGYILPVTNLTTGTSNDAYLVEIRAGTDKPIAIGAIQGHYRSGDSAEDISYALKRASAATPGTGITVSATGTNSDDTAPGWSASTGPTVVTASGPELAVFGGNGAANFGWYPSVEEHQIILKPAEIVVIQVVIAPTSAQTIQMTVGITEL
jgi:hypothetical protein